MTNGLFYLNSLDRFISTIRSVLLGFIVTIFIAIPVLNANTVDPNQNAASDLAQCPFHGTLGINKLIKAYFNLFRSPNPQNLD